ncbi:hypothetical protein K439DRAFT_1619760 [Ramaria rubella]|nr:hypothetical protein K439DRAFT_1619760 [Ramaria rubella]
MVQHCGCFASAGAASQELAVRAFHLDNLGNGLASRFFGAPALAKAAAPELATGAPANRLGPAALVHRWSVIEGGDRGGGGAAKPAHAVQQVEEGCYFVCVLIGMGCIYTVGCEESSILGGSSCASMYSFTITHLSPAVQQCKPLTPNRQDPLGPHRSRRQGRGKFKYVVVVTPEALVLRATHLPRHDSCGAMACDHQGWKSVYYMELRRQDKMRTSRFAV